MKNNLIITLFVFGITFQLFSQETSMIPENNSANTSLIKSESYEMSWSIVQDSLKTEIGRVETNIQKEKENILIITEVIMKQSPSKWVDSTIVKSKNFKPIYHSSYNQQRDMALDFGNKITGYYLNKQTGIKTPISENVDKPFFDSNFYPQLIRLLPLKNKYSSTISIFDYNPSSKIGTMAATIKNTVETTIDFNGKKKRVWKVECTDDISDNAVLNTYYIDKHSRKLLKQEIDFGKRKMLMELVE